MDRRAFLGALGAAASINLIYGDQSPAHREIGYISPQAPGIKVLPCGGERYQDRVPDTLDVAERARLAINALTAPTDPSADYEIYFYLRAFRNPAVIVHDWSDWCQPKFMEDLPLLRMATGDTTNSHVDQAWVDVTTKCIGPDGMFYFPTQGRPWVQEDLSRWLPTVIYPDGPRSTTGNTLAFTQFAHPQPCGRILGMMGVFSKRDPNSPWKDMIGRMVDRWVQLAGYRDDWAWYPRALYTPGASASSNGAEPLVGRWSGETGCRLQQGLVQAYTGTGYEPALKLAGQLSRYTAYHSQLYDAKNGAFMTGLTPELNENIVGYGGHFHTHTVCLLGVLEYAIVAKDAALLEFVRQSYEWGRDHPHSSKLIGFFPERLDDTCRSVETCEVADMIAIGLKLTNAGVGDYWDDVDRWVRNQFFENQLTETDWVYRVAETSKKMPVRSNESAERPAERNLGAFASWATVNDFVLPVSSFGTVITHCCTGNAARAIYYIWENILSDDGEELRLNMLLNHASRSMDVYSYLPCKGRVDFKIKQPRLSLAVRVPEWIESGDPMLTGMVNGRRKDLRWDGRYVLFGRLSPGDGVTVSFPISERTIRARIGEVDYTLTLKGTTVVSVDPTGRFDPLYQRAQYRKSEPTWRMVERFVPNDKMIW